MQTVHQYTKTPEDKSRFTLIKPINKHECTRCYAKFTVRSSDQHLFGHADSGSEMSLITQTCLNSLNLQEIQFVKVNQPLDTFGGNYCTIQEAVWLELQLEGTTEYVPVLFLVSNMSTQCVATIGQDIIRRDLWDFNFGIWKTPTLPPTCQFWSRSHKDNNIQLKSPMYTDEPIGRRHDSHKATQRHNNNTRFSSPYADIDTNGKNITYFIDTGATESCLTSRLIRENGWENLIYEANITVLRGFMALVPILGQLDLTLTLNYQQSDEVMIVKHTFQIISAETADATLGLTFFIQNDLVHSASQGAFSSTNHQNLNPYHYPRDRGVIPVMTKGLNQETCKAAESKQLPEICKVAEKQLPEMLMCKQTIPDREIMKVEVIRPQAIVEDIKPDNQLSSIIIVPHTESHIHDNTQQISTKSQSLQPKLQLQKHVLQPTATRLLIHQISRRIPTTAQTTASRSMLLRLADTVTRLLTYPFMNAISNISYPLQTMTIKITSLPQHSQGLSVQILFQTTALFPNNGQQVLFQTTALKFENTVRRIQNTPAQDAPNEQSVLRQAEITYLKPQVVNHQGKVKETITNLQKPSKQSALSKSIANIRSYISDKLADIPNTTSNMESTFSPSQQHQDHQSASHEVLMKKNEIVHQPLQESVNISGEGQQQTELLNEMINQSAVDDIKQQQEEIRRSENEDEAVHIELQHQLHIPKNVTMMVQIQLSQKLAHHFQKEALIEPTLPLYKGEIQWIYLTRQIITMKEYTCIEMTNPNDYDVMLKPGTFIGVWYLSEKYIKQPFTFENEQARMIAERISRQIKDIIEGLPPEEVVIRIQQITTKAPWLAEFKLQNIQDDKLKLRILIMCLLNQGAFQKKKDELGKYVNGYFDIILQDQTPVKIKQYRTSETKMKLIEKLMKEYYDIGAIEESTSDWNSPAILVSKKRSDKLRVAIDYRMLNKKIEKYSVPLRSTEYYYEKVKKAKYYSVMDISHAYMHLEINPLHKKYTAFTIGLKKYHCNRFSFGLGLSGAYWLAVMYTVLGERFEQSLLYYVDDCLVFTEDVEENLRIIEEVLRRLSRAGLHIKPSKTEFLAREILFLGFYLSATGIRNDPEKIKALLRMQPPTDKTTARSFMGGVNYFRKTLPGISMIAAPIHQVAGKKSIFKWEEPQIKAYNEVLSRICTSPILTRFETNRPVYIYTDASTIGGAAWMLQRDDEGRAHLISTYSKKWNPVQVNQKIAHLETLIVAHAVVEWDSYLAAATEIHIFTDNTCLQHILHMKRPSTQQWRWIRLFNKHKIRFHHVPGVQNVLADHMSRAFRISDQVTPGTNLQVSNYPVIAVSPEAIKRWRVNTMLYMKFEQKFQARQRYIQQLVEGHDPAYKDTIEYIMTQPQQQPQHDSSLMGDAKDQDNIVQLQISKARN